MRVPDVDGETMAERVLAQLLTESALGAAPGAPPAAAPRTGPTAPTAPVVPGPRSGLGPGLGRGRGRRALGWMRRRWRALSVALSGVLVVLVLTPPVRAAVADWFGFGGVEVRYDPSAPPRPGGTVPWCHAPVPLAEAERRGGFRPRVPDGLGEPEAVSLTEGTGGRSVISLCWSERGRTIRLDEFPAELDLGFAKEARLMPQWLELTNGTGLWFAEPHLLRFRMTDARGAGWEQGERTAGPTLLWTTADERTTLRLEGVTSMRRAREIADSTS
ncbi:hypothetical protein OG883_02920 [Streptomyces sp. NBC_01142]|nr:hypothetical protein [Streptomyces sp. NBC_01142]